MNTRFALVAVLAIATALPAMAEIPEWMSGDWRTNARLTAPDGARLRIRCTLDADAQSTSDWAGTLGCATVQGRFEGRWQIAVSGNNASGNVVFSGTESSELNVSGSSSETRMDLASPDGQGVAFAPGEEGALIVEMNALGPQRLTGTLSFEAR